MKLYLNLYQLLRCAFYVIWDIILSINITLHYQWSYFRILWNNQVTFQWIAPFMTVYYVCITRPCWLKIRECSMIRKLIMMVSLWNSDREKGLWVAFPFTDSNSILSSWMLAASKGLFYVVDEIWPTIKMVKIVM